MIIINNANYTKYTLERVIKILIFLKLYIVFSYTKIFIKFTRITLD